MRLGWAFLLLGAVGLVTPACARESCDQNSDCVNAWCNSDNECQQDCRVDLDCPFGMVCNEPIGRCDPGTGGTGGTGGAGGAGGSAAGTGGTGCGGGAAGSAAGSGGTGGGTGATGGAAGSGGTGGGTGATGGTGGMSGSGGSGGTGGTGGMSGSGGTGGGTGGAAGASGTARELDRCYADAECAAGLLCRPFGLGNPSRCVRPCSGSGASTECPSGSRCENSPTQDRYCMPGDVGRPCTLADQCQFACLTAQQYCTSPCQSGADCPNGYGCDTVSGQRVCIKLAAYCDASDLSACAVACDTSGTLLVSGCTQTCSSAADCPQRAAGLPSWTCQGGYCSRPADVLGPVAGGETAEWYCDAGGSPVNLCNDAQHIDFTAFTIPSPPAVDCAAAYTTPGVAGDTCVDSCRHRQGCAHRFTCVGVGSLGGNRIGLCLPAVGSSEVGQPCSSDAECAFGYCPPALGRCSRDCTGDGLCPTGSTCVPGAAGGTPSTVDGQTFRRCE